MKIDWDRILLGAFIVMIGVIVLWVIGWGLSEGWFSG